MALYNNERMFIFFHLYKCGGNSLRRVVNDQLKGSKELLGVHVLPKDVQRHYITRQKLDRFNEMFKFTIVRNPFEFILSNYHYVRKFPNHFMYDEAIKMPFSEFPDFYMEWREKHIEENIHGKNKVCTMYEFLHDDKGNMLMDYIGKLETINEDFKYICEKIGIDYRTMPYINVNKKNDKPYRQVYDDATREKVEKYFAKDLKLLKYEF